VLEKSLLQNRRQCRFHPLFLSLPERERARRRRKKASRRKQIMALFALIGFVAGCAILAWVLGKNLACLLVDALWILLDEKVFFIVTFTRRGCICVFFVILFLILQRIVCLFFFRKSLFQLSGFSSGVQSQRAQKAELGHRASAGAFTTTL